MFESARLKIERADHHIVDIEGEFSAYVREHPYSLMVELNPQTGKPGLKIQFGGPRVTARFSPIIGDAVHNLRSALDHLAWEMVGIDGGTQDRYLQFPIRHDRISFEAACNGVVTPSQAIKDLFKSVEAFPSGKGHALYQIHVLDNADKHTVLAATMRVIYMPAYDILNPDRTVHSRWKGQFWAASPTEIFIPDSRFEFPEGGHVYIKDEAKPSVGIFFGPVETVPLEPVVKTLRKLRHAASDVIDIIAGAMS